MKLFIDPDYGTYQKTVNAGCRRNQMVRCPSKNFNKPKSFKLRRFKCTNIYKPYNDKFANRIYNKLYIKDTLKFKNNHDYVDD